MNVVSPCGLGSEKQERADFIAAVCKMRSFDAWRADLAASIRLATHGDLQQARVAAWLT